VAFLKNQKFPTTLLIKFLVEIECFYFKTFMLTFEHGDSRQVEFDQLSNFQRYNFNFSPIMMNVAISVKQW